VSTEQLRAQLAVAELEEELVDLKDGGDPERLKAVKEDLRFARWVQRGGPAEYEATGEHANRHTAELYNRWKAEQA
jgi:hypothetical protein